MTDGQAIWFTIIIFCATFAVVQAIQKGKS